MRLLVLFVDSLTLDVCHFSPAIKSYFQETSDGRVSLCMIQNKGACVIDSWSQIYAKATKLGLSWNEFSSELIRLLKLDNSVEFDWTQQAFQKSCPVTALLYPRAAVLPNQAHTITAPSTTIGAAIDPIPEACPPSSTCSLLLKNDRDLEIKMLKDEALKCNVG